jgi:hypothetical protein
LDDNSKGLTLAAGAVRWLLLITKTKDEPHENPQLLGHQDATIAVLSAVAANTISKIAIGGIIGRGRFALEIIAMALACFTAGALALWATWAILYR